MGLEQSPDLTHRLQWEQWPVSLFGGPVVGHCVTFVKMSAWKDDSHDGMLEIQMSHMGYKTFCLDLSCVALTVTWWRACNSTLLVARVQTNVVIHCRWYLGISNRVLAFFCTLFLLACLLLYHKYAVISTSRRVACTHFTKTSSVLLGSFLRRQFFLFLTLRFDLGIV